MKKRNLLSILLLSSVALSFSGCNKEPTPSTTPSTTPSDESSIVVPTPEPSEELSSGEENKEPIYNENYQWPFEEKGAYKENLELTTSAYDYSETLKLKIDGNEVEPADYVNYDGMIYWDADPDHLPHSDSMENAANNVTFNGEKMGRLRTDDSIGIPIKNSQLVDGDNVFTTTIGVCYGGGTDQPYLPGQATGGINGRGDDYRVGNFRMVMKDGTVIKPSKMVLHKAKAAHSTQTVKEEIQQQDGKFYWVGDGWSGNLAYAGNPDPRYDIPYLIEYHFEVWTPGAINTYNIDTTKYSNGLHDVSLFDNGKEVLYNKVYFDNDKPKLIANIKEYDNISNGYTLESLIQDDTTDIIEKYVRVDGKDITTRKFSLKDYAPGSHTLMMYAKDKAGNISRLAHQFTKLDGVDTISVTNDNKKLSIKGEYQSATNLQVYEASKLNYTSKTPLNNKQESVDEIPYDEFIVDVKNNNKLYLSYKGETYKGERLAIEAYNPTSKAYERISLANGGEEVKFMLDPTSYNDNNKVKIRVRPNYWTNGSNRLLWASDTQFLPRAEFSDINWMYDALMQYVAEEYDNGKMSYFVHTGDIIDNPPEYGDSAIKQWEIASHAFKILDDHKVPYGVVAGNHDVSNAEPNYTFYDQFFNVNRFAGSPVFGGAVNNTESHYDLVTIGEYDFVFVYIGYNVEVAPHTIKWANEVLKTYSHRNAVICTHSYIDDLELYYNKAEEMIDAYIKPNENVKFVFCGHTDGNAAVKRDFGKNADGSQRWVYELLNCYQFVEKKKYEIPHLINNLTCNGEGFIKELVFDGDMLKCHTFSPVTHDTKPWSDGGDDWEMKIELTKNPRIITTNSFEVYQANSDVVKTEENVGETITLSDLDASKDYIALLSDAANSYGFVYID